MQQLKLGATDVGMMTAQKKVLATYNAQDFLVSKDSTFFKLQQSYITTFNEAKAAAQEIYESSRKASFEDIQTAAEQHEAQAINACRAYQLIKLIHVYEQIRLHSEPDNKDTFKDKNNNFIQYMEQGISTLISDIQGNLQASYIAQTILEFLTLVKHMQTEVLNNNKLLAPLFLGRIIRGFLNELNISCGEKNIITTLRSATRAFNTEAEVNAPEQMQVHTIIKFCDNHILMLFDKPLSNLTTEAHRSALPPIPTHKKAVPPSLLERRKQKQNLVDPESFREQAGINSPRSSQESPRSSLDHEIAGLLSRSPKTRGPVESIQQAMQSLREKQGTEAASGDVILDPIEPKLHPRQLDHTPSQPRGWRAWFPCW